MRTRTDRPVRGEAKATEFDLDEQHSAARIFETPPDDLHTYVRAYLEAAGLA